MSRSAINSGPVGAGKDVPIPKPRLRFQRTVTTSTGQASPERLVPAIGGGNEIENTEDASDAWFGKSRPEMGGVWSGQQIGRRSIRSMYRSIHFELQLLHVQIPGNLNQITRADTTLDTGIHFGHSRTQPNSHLPHVCLDVISNRQTAWYEDN